MSRSRHPAIVAVLLVLAGTAIGKTLPVPSADYPTIQTAIDAAGSGDRIAVAPGTYTEDINFLGKAVHLYSRSGDPANTTILGTGSGPVVTCYSEETSAAVLEGFTITGGSGWAAGMYTEDSRPTVANCTFSNNSGAGMGIGMGGSPTVTNCTFSNNSDAGMDNGMDGSPTVTNCTFSNNSGSGMINEYYNTATVTDCTFIDNGYIGIYNGHASETTVARCAFRGNSVGMWNDEDSGADVNDCLFSENSGDGMYNNEYSYPTVTNCLFIDNGGRGMYNFSTAASVTNCAFLDNSAAGIYNDEYSYPTVVNCIFVDNSGPGMHNQYTEDNSRHPTVTNCTFLDNAGGGIYNSYSHPDVTNCILWSNAGGPILGDPGNVTYSDVEGGWVGEGNIDADPLFVDARAGDCRLAQGSPCIDAGTNSPTGGLPSTDIEDNPRPMDGDHDKMAVADMGAYEASGKKK